MDDHSDESKSRRRWPTYLVTILILLLVIYPLNFGPAAGILYRFHEVLPENTWMIYWPLLAAMDATGNERIYESYATWWFQVTNTEMPG